MDGDIPVEKRPVDNSRPTQALALLRLQIIRHVRLALQDRHQRHRLRVGGIAAEIGGDEAFHACLDRGVDDGVLHVVLGGGDGADDGVLALERGDEGWERVVGFVDFEVRRERRG